MHSWSGGEEAHGVIRCHERGLEAVRAVNTHGSVLVFRHGAQVVEYQPATKAPVLWLSQKSRFENTAAIRGGVPICFPWFGAHPTDPKLPAHGFARTSAFDYLGSTLEAGVTRLSFELLSDAATRVLWPFEFRAQLHVVLGVGLTLELEVENRDQRDLEFEEALHSYFVVSDVRQIQIEGLEGARYADKVAGSSELQRERHVTISAETDRVYESSSTCLIVDAGLDRNIEIATTESATTVVWNPWVDKARRMSDFGDDEYLGMVCVESANTGAARIRLEPGQKHTLGATITPR